MNTKLRLTVLAVSLLVAAGTQAAPQLIAIGSLSGSLSDLSSATSGALENGVAGNILGGLGSGLAWAGGSTFLATPDRGPNAVTYNSLVDNTTSYINRFQTLNLELTATASGSLPYTLTPSLTQTTLLYSTTPLIYGTGALGTGTGIGPGGSSGSLTLGSGAPTLNTANTYYFAGRSDNFDASQNSLNPDNGRFDPEAIRVANNGQSVFIADEYGPYVYQFDRSTGQRLRTYSLPTGNVPDNFAISSLSAQGSLEISGNTSGRVANKGMEGLAISPDGSTLFGMMQSPLLQDGGDGGRIQRIITIDVSTGATHEYAYDNRIGTKNYNVSEIVALNNHQFLIDERDGKGLGDSSDAVIKQLYQIDLTNAEDVSGISGEANLLPKAVSKHLFLDFKTTLNNAGITSNLIPAKIESVALGADIVDGGVTKHTLYIANDNDFLDTANLSVGGTASNPNQFYVLAFQDSDLPIANSVVQLQNISAPVPVPAAVWLFGSALASLIGFARNKKSA